MISRGMIEIYKRELRNYFNTPIGYVFMTGTLIFNFLFFFLGIFDIVPAFWEARSASVRGYMNLLPVAFILIVPAVTMRIWSEERKLGTYELIMTLPVSDLELVAGKLGAAWTFVSGLIFASLPLTLSIALIGNLDGGTTFTMYVGSVLMAGAYVSMGMVISALTREQVASFVVIFFLSLFMFLSNYYIVSRHLPGAWSSLAGYVSLSYHFSSFARGVFAFADVVYYLSFTFLMSWINIWVLRGER